MLEDLNRYSDFCGKIEKKKVRCLVLVQTHKGDDKIKSKGSKQEINFHGKLYLRNAPISSLITWMNSLKELTLPVIDETHYLGLIDIQLQNVAKETDELRKELQQFGLDIVQVERELEMFILSDKKKNQ